MTTRVLRRLLAGAALLLPGGTSALLGACAATPASCSVASSSSGARNGGTTTSESAFPGPGPALIAEALHLVETLGDDAWPGFGRDQCAGLVRRR